MSTQEVLDAIPHRDPFLFIDDILSLSCKKIECTRKISGKEDFFKGHYPGNPVMPGVILCETIFQAGAILISRIINEEITGTPVVTRVNDIKFKNMVKPGDNLNIEVELTEKITNVYFLKGKIKRENKTCVQLNFACTMIKGEM